MMKILPKNNRAITAPSRVPSSNGIGIGISSVSWSAKTRGRVGAWARLWIAPALRAGAACRSARSAGLQGWGRSSQYLEGVRKNLPLYGQLAAINPQLEQRNGRALKYERSDDARDKALGSGNVCNHLPGRPGDFCFYRKTAGASGHHASEREIYHRDYTLRHWRAQIGVDKDSVVRIKADDRNLAASPSRTSSERRNFTLVGNVFFMRQCLPSHRKCLQVIVALSRKYIAKN